MASPETSECSICRLPFAQSTHNRQTTCPFCNRTFSRVDVVRRHARKCTAKGNRSLPVDAKRGRKLRACDACSRIKVSCNAEAPCQRCSSRKVTCTYGRLCTDPAHRQGSSRGDGNQQLGERFSALPFLLKCTDPRVEFVGEVFVAEESERDPATPAAWNQFSADSVRHDTIDPRLLLLGFIDPCFDMSLDCDTVLDAGCPADMALTLPPAPNDGLAAQVRLLEADLQQLIDTQPNLNSITLQDSFRDFFTCANFQSLITVFFRGQQLLAKSIHWPTFNPSNVDPGLLLAIALCGTIHSRKPVESLKLAPTTTTISDMAENYIFKRLKRHRDRGESRSALEVCQAAQLMIALQISRNDRDTRRRVITKRQPALVDALRRLGVISGEPSSPMLKTDWHEFVYRESCTRLAAAAFCTDGLMAILCNRPPNTTVAEMSRDPSCRDELWEADCPSSFAVEQTRQETLSQCPTAKDVLAALLDDDWEDAAAGPLGNLTSSQLYAAIGALQYVLFNYRANMLPKSFGSVLLRALDRWEQLWHAAMDRVPHDRQSWLGVAKYSPEFALISRRIVEVGHTKEGKCSRYLNCTAQDDFSLLHEFILQHGLASPTTKATVGDAS